MNHSDTPNVGPDFARDRYGVDVALRDIVAGEEITVDYRLVEGWIVERSREAGAVGMPARMGVNPVAPPAGR